MMEQFRRTLYNPSIAFRWFDDKLVTATGWLNKLKKLKMKAMVNQLSDAQLLEGPWRIPAP